VCVCVRACVFVCVRACVVLCFLQNNEYCVPGSGYYPSFDTITELVEHYRDQPLVTADRKVLKLTKVFSKSLYCSCPSKRSVCSSIVVCLSSKHWTTSFLFLCYKEKICLSNWLGLCELALEGLLLQLSFVSHCFV
jgi:hypothetical protein